MDDLWDVIRLAKFLAVKKSTVYKMVEQKEIPHYRVGRLARFQPSEILDWLSTQKHGPTNADNKHKRFRKSVKKSDCSYHSTAKIIVRQAIDTVKK